MRTILVYSERANMIGISENAVLSFCATLSTDIVAVMVRVSANRRGITVRPGPIFRAVLEIAGVAGRITDLRTNYLY